MGGSGGGGGGPLVGPASNELDCAMVTFETALERVPSPPKCKPYDTLRIVRDETETGNRIVAVDNNSHVVGVVRENLGILNKCMDNGTIFIAYVKGVTAGVYKVTVHADS